MTLRTIVALLGASVLLGGCGFWGSSPVAPPSPLTSFTPTVKTHVDWQTNIGASGHGIFRPAVASGYVYVAGSSGKIAKIDAVNGSTVWQIDAGQPLSGGVGAGDDMVLVGTPMGEVLAYATSGKQLWKAKVSSAVLSAPVPARGIVVVRSADDRLYGLDAADGKRKWVYERQLPSLTLRTYTGVTVDRGAVFAGFPGGRLVALNAETGAVGWAAAVALPHGTTELERVTDVSSLPVTDPDQVCAVAYQGRVACFDIRRGTLNWARSISSSAGMALDGRYVYVTDDQGAVAAFSEDSGTSAWKQSKLLRRRVSGPLAIDHLVVVGDYEGYVHLLSRDNGAFAARVATDGSAITVPPVALGESSFVVQTQKGGVFAISIK